jgi:hypothetical protein
MSVSVTISHGRTQDDRGGAMVTESQTGRLMQRRNLKPIGEEFTEEQLRALYEPLAEEDVALADLGMQDYAERLSRIDAGEEPC